MNLYKIKNRKTGLYCTGGSHPQWTAKGKSWNTMGHVKAHLTWIRQWPDLANIYNDADIVELELVERKTMSVVSILTITVAERVKKEAEERARAYAAERQRDIAEMERLKAKLGL
jgi:hypothetical protein